MFLDIQNSVINKLRLDATNDLQKVKDWINQIYAQICVETGANASFATMTLTSGSASYTFPTQVERVKSMFVTPVGGTANAPLQPVSLDYINRRRMVGGGVATATGTVTHYALLGINDFEVYPTPQAADVITIYYESLPTALSGNTDVPILHEPWASKLLEYGALAEGADFLNHPDEPKYRGLYEGWMTRYIAHLNRKGPKPDQLEVFGAFIYPSHDPSTDLGR